MKIFRNQPMKFTAGILVLFVLLLSHSTVHAQDDYQKYDVVVEIEGMVCPFCSYGLEQALNKMEQINQTDVSILDGLAKIILVDDQQVTKELITGVITDAGYKTDKFIKFPGDTTLANFTESTDNLSLD